MYSRFFKKFFLYSFAVYGAVWTILEPVLTFLGHNTNGPLWYFIIVVGSVSYGIYKAIPTNKIEFKVPGSDSVFAIEFGDIFEKTGCIAIKVNEFFGSKLGDHVAESTVHGQLISLVFGGAADVFNCH